MYNLTTVIMTLIMGVIIGFGICILFGWYIGKKMPDKVFQKKLYLVLGYDDNKRVSVGIYNSREQADRFMLSFYEKVGDDTPYWFTLIPLTVNNQEEDNDKINIKLRKEKENKGV